MRLHAFKWLLAAGVVAGSVTAYLSRSELQQWFRLHQFRIEGLDLATPSELYFLETNRWLEFDIPQDARMARLISNASISRAEKASPGTQWPYAIEYELRPGHDRTDVTGVFHFKGEQLAYLDRKSGRPVEANYYLERRRTPLSGRHWLLNFADPAYNNARLLRLRLHSSDPGLLEVGVRVYFRTDVPERKVGYMWERLSEDQKRDLARGHHPTMAKQAGLLPGV
jgi:hypothetical protein